METILFILICYGACNNIIYGSIFESFRNSLAKFGGFVGEPDNQRIMDYQQLLSESNKEKHYLITLLSSK